MYRKIVAAMFALTLVIGIGFSQNTYANRTYPVREGGPFITFDETSIVYKKGIYYCVVYPVSAKGETLGCATVGTSNDTVRSIENQWGDCNLLYKDEAKRLMSEFIEQWGVHNR